MDSIALDPATWDFTVDAYGDWATVGDATPGLETGPEYRMAQDVATRLMAWRGEVYYDTTQGMPYDTLLGSANVALLQALATQEALKVTPVVACDASLTFTRGKSRTVTGTIYVSDAQGSTGAVFL